MSLPRPGPLADPSRCPGRSPGDRRVQPPAGGRERAQGARPGDPRSGRRSGSGRARSAALLGRRTTADNGRRLVGQTAITREWSDWRNGWIWWLQSVYIQADFRGQGVFKALYRHIYDQALASSNVGLRLYVENSNLRAQQTYQALGMKPGGYSVLEELWLHRSSVD